MASLLLAVIYLAFISLGLPDSLLGSGWPSMQAAFSVPSSYAGYVSMTICCMTIVSALVSPKLIRKIPTEWIVIFSVFLTVAGLMGFSFSTAYWMLFVFAVPYGLGAGAIDAALNHYVAMHYPSSVMNFLHCFYGVGAMISPGIMALALRYAHWNQGYRWTAFLQFGILIVCMFSLPLWKSNNKQEEQDEKDVEREVLRAEDRKGVFAPWFVPGDRAAKAVAGVEDAPLQMGDPGRHARRLSALEVEKVDLHVGGAGRVFEEDAARRRENRAVVLRHEHPDAGEVRGVVEDDGLLAVVDVEVVRDDVLAEDEAVLEPLDGHVAKDLLVVLVA